MVEGVELPVMESIALRRLPTVAVVLIWPEPAVPLTKVSVVPLIVSVSPAVKPGDSESVPVAPDSGVALLIAAGGMAWLLAVATLAVLKKSLPASIAEAATRVVLATVPIAPVSAVLRLAAVSAGVVPMVKLPVGAGDVVVAVS